MSGETYDLDIDDCDHDDYDLDIFIGRASCNICNYRWYMSADELRVDEELRQLPFPPLTMDDQKMSEVQLDALADLYRQEYGESEYRYFKKQIVWSRPRRQRGQHIVPLNDGVTVTKEEYEANIEGSNHDEREAFMSRLPQSYWRYGRQIAKDGWHEILTKDVGKLKP